MSETRGCPRSKASKGEAVVGYRESLATKEMGYHRLSRRVNKMKIQNKNYISYMEESQNSETMLRMWLCFYLIQCFFVLFTLN
jgi:hypothetical protein